MHSKKMLSKVLAGVLCVAMTFQNVSVTTYAAESATEQVEVQEQNESTEESPVVEDAAEDAGGENDQEQDNADAP